MNINKGSIVRYNNGWYKITYITSNWCNLGGIFTGNILYKRIPLYEVFEDFGNWDKAWKESESYKCM